MVSNNSINSDDSASSLMTFAPNPDDRSLINYGAINRTNRSISIPILVASLFLRQDKLKAFTKLISDFADKNTGHKDLRDALSILKPDNLQYVSSIANINSLSEQLTLLSTNEAFKSYCKEKKPDLNTDDLNISALFTKPSLILEELCTFIETYNQKFNNSLFSNLPKTLSDYLLPSVKLVSLFIEKQGQSLSDLLKNQNFLVFVGNKILCDLQTQKNTSTLKQINYWLKRNQAAIYLGVNMVGMVLGFFGIYAFVQSTSDNIKLKSIAVNNDSIIGDRFVDATEGFTVEANIFFAASIVLSLAQRLIWHSHDSEAFLDQKQGATKNALYFVTKAMGIIGAPFVNWFLLSPGYRTQIDHFIILATFNALIQSATTAALIGDAAGAATYQLFSNFKQIPQIPRLIWEHLTKPAEREYDLSHLKSLLTDDGSNNIASIDAQTLLLMATFIDDKQLQELCESHLPIMQQQNMWVARGKFASLAVFASAAVFTPAYLGISKNSATGIPGMIGLVGTMVYFAWKAAFSLMSAEKPLGYHYIERVGMLFALSCALSFSNIWSTSLDAVEQWGWLTPEFVEQYGPYVMALVAFFCACTVCANVLVGSNAFKSVLYSLVEVVANALDRNSIPAQDRALVQAKVAQYVAAPAPDQSVPVSQPA